MKTTRLLKTTKKLKKNGIEDILVDYINLNERYIRHMKNKDCAFVYTEMANVGMFAAAASMNGWSAVCETQLDKYHIDDGGRILKKSGRSDLYLTNRNHEYMCEAKFLGTDFLENENTTIELFKKFMGIALDDTKKACEVYDMGKAKLIKKDCCDGLALLFIYHELNAKSKFTKKVWSKEKTSHAIKKFGQNCDGYASYFLPKPISGWDDGTKTMGLTVFVNVHKTS